MIIAFEAARLKALSQYDTLSTSFGELLSSGANGLSFSLTLTLYICLKT